MLYAETKTKMAGYKSEAMFPWISIGILDIYFVKFHF